MSNATIDHVKFGPPPETGARSYLALHFALCVAVLAIVRPPVVVTDTGGVRLLLILLVAAALTCVVHGLSEHDAFVSA